MPLPTYSLVAIGYCNNYTIDRIFRHTRSTFDIYHSSYPIQVQLTILPKK